MGNMVRLELERCEESDVRRRQPTSSLLLQQLTFILLREGHVLFWLCTIYFFLLRRFSCVSYVVFHPP